MSGLDSRFVVAPSLEMYFVDKDTGAPLAGGLVYFFRDIARSTVKPIYEISGIPPNYVYTQITGQPIFQTPIQLSAVGTFQDQTGKNCLPYYYPYTGLPTDPVQGVLDLYYIKVTDANGVFQFDVEGWPNVTGAITPSPDIQFTVTNLIPNGQFVMNNAIPAFSGNNYMAGLVWENATPIASGGWFYTKTGLTGMDFITFTQLTSDAAKYTENPRYAININASVPGSDTYKYLQVFFPNANTFTDSINSPSVYNVYTLYFEAATNSGTVQVNGVITYYYGVGGSGIPAQVIFTGPTITSTPTQYVIVFTFPNLTGTIGTMGDDYVAVGLSFPSVTSFNVQLTNFALVPGKFTVSNFPTFPVQNSMMQFAQSTAGYLPYTTPADQVGYDLFLPILRGPEGFTYDYQQIGKIQAAMYVNNLAQNELEANGAIYQANNYSSTGIPYARLGSVLWDSTIKNYIFSTGNASTGYYNAYYPSSTGVGASIRVTQNTPGMVTTFTDVATSGFTAVHIYTGISPPSPPYNCNAVLVGSTSSGTDTVIITGTYADQSGSGNGPADSQNASTFTITILDGYQYQNVSYNSVIPDQYSVLFPAAASITGGTSYFIFSVTESNNTTQQTNAVWYTKDGSGSIPGGISGATNKIQVNVLSTDTAYDVAEKTAAAINNLDSIAITAPAGSTLVTGTTGKSFLLQDQPETHKFQYWFNTGTETAPTASSGYTLVQINVSPTATASQVAAALTGSYSGVYMGTPITLTLGINSYFYQVPDLRGWLLRGWNNGSVTDTKVLNRYSNATNYYGDAIGTYQLDYVRQHTHVYSTYETSAPSGVTSGADYAGIIYPFVNVAFNTGNWGGTENLVKNVSVNYVIKY